MRIRLVRPHEVYRPGQVLDVQDGQANLWIQRKIAEPVIEEEKTETATYPKRGKR